MMALLLVMWMCQGCAMNTGTQRPSSITSTQMKENVEYLRAFSREQEESIKAMTESVPHWGAHKEAIDYGDFLEERAPRVLQIVENLIPPSQRTQFRSDQKKVEANVMAAVEQNESRASEMEGGTLARTIRHNGTRIPMQIRIASLSPWIPYLPAPLQAEIRTICERTAKH